MPGLEAGQLVRDRWTLAGLTLLIESDATTFALTPGDGFIDVEYRGATRLGLRVAGP